MTDYSDGYKQKTGIKFSAAIKNDAVTETNKVLIDSTSVNIDFSEATRLRVPLITTGSRTYYDTLYNFQIISGEEIKWYAKYVGSVDNNVYRKEININGYRTTDTSNDSSFLTFSPTDFGSVKFTIGQGNYAIKITREYHWEHSTNEGLTVYESSSTLIGQLVIDTVAPRLSVKGETSGKEIANNSFVNEKVILTVNDANFSKLYIKQPNSNNYIPITKNNYTMGGRDGWYYAYATDSVGQRSVEFSIYFDDKIPVGVLYSGGKTIEHGSYINQNFSYTATDNESGISKVYYKPPISEIFVQYSLGTIIQSNSGDGWYSFYAVDVAGNISETISVFLETQDPLVNIYRNGVLAYSKTITDVSSYDTDIYFCPNDTLKVSCDTSSGHVTSNYMLDTNITIGSEYSGSNYTIDITTATGITSHFTYHIVRDKPAVVIDGKTYSDGCTVYFNADKTASFVCDSIIKNLEDTGVSISSAGNVNLNEHIAYASGKGKTLITAADTETKYILHLNDRAGNESTIIVFVDKCAAIGEWKSGDKTLENNSYTNEPLSFNFTEAGVTAVYSYNGGEYQSYTSDKAFTADGTYVIVLTDLAGNKSSFTARIDTVPPVGHLYANYKPVENGTVTSERIYMSWDGDITATVNGESYTKNSVLSEDGVYNFVLTDLAGNCSEYNITIDTVAPTFNADKLNNSQQLISKWYVVTTVNKQYSFATYDEALACACNIEFSQSVTVLVLNDVADFKQHHLIANGDEVRTGEYWLYNSKANPDSLLYYFNRDGLDEVMAHYAKSNVSKVNYLVLDGENVYGEVSESMSDNLFTAPNGTKAPLLNGFVFDKADGWELYAELVGGDGARTKIEYGVAFEKQISKGGLYKLTEVDEAKNETVFYGFMDVLAPELKVTVRIYGNENETELNITKSSLTGIAAYYYESFDVNTIADADKWAMLSVKSNSVTNYYTCDDELPCLTNGGEYFLSVYDRLGNGYSFTVFIVGNPANITVQANSENTVLGITITLEQKFDTVVSLEIKRNGETLSGITTDKLQYSFDRSGIYTVILRDNFGRVIEREYTFNKALPNGTLGGVENGGKTKSDVTFTYDNSKYVITVLKNGEAVEVESSGKLVITASDKNSGRYYIRLTRIADEENFTEYTFVINTLVPDFVMSVADGATTNKNVSVTWTAVDIVSVTYSFNGGEALEIMCGAELTAEGSYTVTATNDLGTASIKTFVIDRTLDYDVLFNDTESGGVDTTNSNVTVINNEPLYVSVSKNGVPFEFVFGQVLSEEGVYIFRISDDYNNSTSFTIIIDKSVDVEANVGNGVISNEDVIISAGEKVNLIATKDGVEYSYSIGMAIADEGFYKFTIYDLFGNEKTLTFRIVKGTKTKLDYTLGDSVEIVSVDRDGEVVTTDGNRLSFTVDGMYTVVCKSEGREYVFTLSLDTTAPTVNLNGIEDGGKGNVTVTITDLSEAGIVEVYKDGEKIEYELGNELKEYGDYEVRVSDELGNERVYKFTLEYQMNGGAIALIIIGIFLAVDIVIAIIFGKKAVYKRKFKNALKLTDEEMLVEESGDQTYENTEEDADAE